MTHRGLRCLMAALLAALVAAAVPAGAETASPAGNSGISGEIDAGVQQKKISGDAGKFEEYRDVQNGFLVNDLGVRLDRDASGYYLDVRIKNPVRDDERYLVTGGKHGKYRFKFTFDSIPHNFSGGRLLFTGAGTGQLHVADSVQSALQAVEQTRLERGGNPLVDTTGEDATAQGIVGGLYAEANPHVFRLKRQATGFSVDYNVTDSVRTWFRGSNEKRTGTRLTSAGTYERFAQGAAGLTHTEDLFLVSGADLAEPIDYRTTTLALGVGVYKPRWLADLEYSFTDFRNEFASLVWDNPFRIADATATNASDVAAAAGDNGFNRGRFAKGQLSLVPDSRSHDFTVSASFDLPHRSKFTGTIGYGWITQDDAFVPYTLNSAIAGVAGGPANITDPSILPQGNLNGKVQTLTQSYVLTARLADPLKATLKYRYYDYDNRSDEIHFPGYAAFGESYWRTKKNDPGVNNVFNEPLSYTRQTAELSLDYHVAKPLTLLFEGGWEKWDREKLRVDSTDEFSIGGGLLYRPSRKAHLKAAYKYADRNVDGYKTGATAANPEAIGLVNYDWADRKRNKADARFQYDPFETVSLGLSGQYLNDKLGGDSRFGLKKKENVAGGVDVTYAPSEALALSLNYLREYRKSEMQSGAKDDAFNEPATAIDDAFATDAFNPLNYWNTDITDKTDTVGIGARIDAIPGKLTLNAGYNLSYGKTDYNNSNPNAAVAQAIYGRSAKLVNGVAQQWPSVRNRYHEIKADAAYRFTENLKAGIGYLFEWYKLDDFAWNDLQPYMAGLSAENSTRFVFADATYKGYEAHVGRIYLAWKF